MVSCGFHDMQMVSCGFHDIPILFVLEPTNTQLPLTIVSEAV